MKFYAPETIARSRVRTLNATFVQHRSRARYCMLGMCPAPPICTHRTQLPYVCRNTRTRICGIYHTKKDVCECVCVRALELSAGFHRAETELVRFVISAVFGKPSWENSGRLSADDGGGGGSDGDAPCSVRGGADKWLKLGVRAILSG